MKPKPETFERRVANRYSLNVTVMIHEMMSSPAAAIGGVSRNVSDAGICLSTAKPLAHSSVVRCEVAVSDAPVAVPTMAQVRWVEKRQGAEYRCGLVYIL
jgi:PilZ domain